MIQEGPLFTADWIEATFIHFKISAQQLQPLIPFQLDTWRGDAYVSAVAFTQSRLRPAGSGRLCELLSWPLGHHEFLNLRTYVKVGEERGIYFISEWIPNRLAVLIGPKLYGLPYRWGQLRYQTSPRRGAISIDVAGHRDRFTFSADFNPLHPSKLAEPGSLDYFLLERYIAFTSHDKIQRCFHVVHKPWPIHQIKPHILDQSLFDRALPHLLSGQAVLGHYSAGVFNVSIGPPRKQTYGSGSDTIMRLRSGSLPVCQKPM